MTPITYSWQAGGEAHELRLVFVEGTRGRPYTLGDGKDSRQIEVNSFYLATTPVTRALWTHLFDAQTNPTINPGDRHPLENISWDQITQPRGFMNQVNHSPIRAAIASQFPDAGEFRLPSEAEWEYAARGGPHWRDGFRFSGSNDIDAVAWYDRRRGDHTQPVALKAPNQLGLFDMCGNVWEWCQDVHTRDVSRIPADGAPFAGPGDDRILRGGCWPSIAPSSNATKLRAISTTAASACGWRCP